MDNLPPPPIQPPIVWFVACHPAAGAHFADFYYELAKQGKVRCRILATEKAAEELSKRKVPIHHFYSGKNLRPLKDLPEKLQDTLADSIANICKGAQCVITDLGGEFTARVHDKLAKLQPSILRVAYYDNPEAFVPGGYSATASKVMRKAQVIFFANAKLADAPIYEAPDHPVDLNGKQTVGLGYANLKDIEDLREKRKSNMRLPLRSSLLQQSTSSLAVYFGGANETYYGQAFPRFLEILSDAAKSDDLSSLTILLQQHPRSVLEGNRDGLLVQEWQKTATPQAPKIAISTVPFNDALIAADLALYYQTSAASKFMLAGLPSAQIGHEPFPDILVRNGFCPAVTDANQFLELFKNFPTSPSQELCYKILNESGIDPVWPERLSNALELLMK